MDGATFAEWMAYDSLEPIDPAGAMLRSLAGNKDAPKSTTRAPWMAQKLAMIQHNNMVQGKKSG